MIQPWPKVNSWTANNILDFWRITSERLPEKKRTAVRTGEKPQHQMSQHDMSRHKVALSDQEESTSVVTFGYNLVRHYAG